MTHEELAMVSLKTFIEEIRFFYEASSKEAHRYMRLKEKMARHLRDQEDAEFREYLQRSYPLFAPTDEERHLKMSLHTMESPEAREAMVHIHEHVADELEGDDHA